MITYDIRKEKILEFMKEEAYKPLLIKELSYVLNVPKSEMEELKKILLELELEGKIFKTNKERYGIPDRMNLIVGRFQGNDRGYGFIIPDDESIKDIFISAESLNAAMHNDRVVARINKKQIGDKRAEGEIIKVIKRSNEKIVGTFESSKHFGFVIPDDPKIARDIFIPKAETNSAKTGDKVVVEIVKWPEKRRNAEGKITSIIGKKGDSFCDILSLIKSFDLSEEFPEKVLSELNSISEKISEKEINTRRDLRSLTMVTIDGEDAKDLDDAVSIEKLPNGIYRLGVHIADVSYYVKENTSLDKEALKRGTSVYLIDRVIPMLPKKLSNGICSLNPNIDRLSFSVIMDIDENGKVINHDIFESVININERMTYTNVYKILEENDEELCKRYHYLINDFKLMKELAGVLYKKRQARGSIDFEFEESKIILDEKGVAVDVKKYQVTIANKIIEEFMLACNEVVAEHFSWISAPFLYRIHENPDSSKIEALAEIVHNMGYVLKGINKIHPKALQELIYKVKGTKEERVISTIMLRSLQKARYSNKNDGHFGLAAKFYCHFTSPIRRYPDLMIHRIMKEYLKGTVGQNREDYLNSNLPDIASWCSTKEQAAQDAERAIETIKKVEFIKKFEGEIFKGIISGVTSFGMFVELESTVEGIVKLSSLEDDYYVFDDKHYQLIGERTRNIYRLGDEVTIMVLRADIAARRVEFGIVPDEKDEQSEDEKDYKIKKSKKKKRK